METKSFWEAISKRTTTYPTLTDDIEVDIAIVGGGITGITAANQLIESGKTVAIFDSYKIGGITTGYSTGNLYIAVQPFYQKIASKFDFDTAKKVAHSRQLAIDYIEANIKKNKITCQFSRRPWYAYTAKDERISLAKEVELLRRMDISVDYIDALPLNLPFKKAICIENQARFNPLQYVISMAEALNKKGCLIFENTKITNFKESQHVCILQTEHNKITAKKVLLATHTPIGIHSTQVFTAPYRSYVVAVELKDKQYPEGHFWDLDRPPHSVCTHAISSEQPEILMVAGSHHKTGQDGDMQKNYDKLESFLETHFSVAKTAYRWSAQHYQTADDVPYIGLASRSAKHTYLATGYFADGLTYGTLAGMLIADLIAGKSNQLINTYQSKRLKPIASSGFLIKENMNVFLQYLKDYPIFKTIDFDSIKPGEGKIVEIEREKYAVCRDDKNKLHIVSAVCTHMKCIVSWNSAEKTWDCPCHGSRFTCQGKVIDGPAMVDLPKKS